jgi:arabinan endo-1,5-alpha-L-arabinosidase
MYYSVSTLGSQTSAIGFATSKDMSPGSWEDHGSAGVASNPNKPYNSIDSSLVQADGKLHMIFGSFWRGIFIVEMHDPPTAPISDPVNIAYEPDANHPIEGSSIFKHGDFYYLFFSHGKCCKLEQGLPPPGGEYKIKVCRSKNPTGGYVSLITYLENP